MSVADEIKEDNNLQDIVLHLQQLLLSENVLSTHQPEGRSQFSSTSSDDYLDQLAPIVRDAITSNKTDELRSGLDAITKSKDQEIETLCNGNQNVCIGIHMQLFVD